MRPDIIIVSSKSKQMGIVELTVPIEERIEISGQLKRNKYERIITKAKWTEIQMLGCRSRM